MARERHSSDIEHHTKEWSSGARGGGRVPADFEWGTNPKQWQEENGTSEPVGAVRERLDEERTRPGAPPTPESPQS